MQTTALGACGAYRHSLLTARRRRIRKTSAALSQRHDRLGRQTTGGRARGWSRPSRCSAQPDGARSAPQRDGPRGPNRVPSGSFRKQPQVSRNRIGGSCPGLEPHRSARMASPGALRTSEWQRMDAVREHMRLLKRPAPRYIAHGMVKSERGGARDAFPAKMAHMLYADWRRHNRGQQCAGPVDGRRRRRRRCAGPAAALQAALRVVGRVEILGRCGCGSLIRRIPRREVRRLLGLAVRALA